MGNMFKTAVLLAALTALLLLIGDFLGGARAWSWPSCSPCS